MRSLPERRRASGQSTRSPRRSTIRTMSGSNRGIGPISTRGLGNHRDSSHKSRRSHRGDDSTDRSIEGKCNMNRRSFLRILGGVSVSAMLATIIPFARRSKAVILGDAFELVNTTRDNPTDLAFERVSGVALYEGRKWFCYSIISETIDGGCSYITKIRFVLAPSHIESSLRYRESIDSMIEDGWKLACNPKPRSLDEVWRCTPAT